MRRSRDVQLTLLATVALAMIGCRQHRDCVDSSNRLLPDSACQSTYPSSGAHWMYGGSSGGHLGDSVVGGSVTRGGFGGIGGGGAGGE